MNNYKVKKYIKLILLISAGGIGISTLFISQNLVKKIAKEEQKKIKNWAEATKIVSDPELNPETDISFYLKIIEDNTTIPVILVDEKNTILSFKNLDSIQSKNISYVKKKLIEFQRENTFISIPIQKNIIHHAYYGESSVLKNLRYYPWYILAVVSLFILVSYFAFSISRRAEQNRVWVGLAKETAHQLGTPISSLMGWIEYLESFGEELRDNAGQEMRKDIQRLQIITERFSKIGSDPELSAQEFDKVLSSAVEYMKQRAGSKVHISLSIQIASNWVEINTNLFEWVIENLLKNAIDAIENEGRIDILLFHKGHKFVLDIKDSGKGIKQSDFKNVFKPGFTTKKRGWGLGLSLAKRIIENYHKGEIFVKESTLGTGTTFRIVMPVLPEKK